MNTRPHVVLVSGSGRSGSTLLSGMLSQFSDTCGVGEAIRLWECCFIRGELCGCGRPLTECPMWRTALANLGINSNTTARELVSLRNRCLKWSEIARLAAGKPTGRMKAYVSLLQSLFQEVFHTSHYPVIVDSSKFPPYLAVLIHALRSQVSLVHIVRDPRAVAFSLQRKVRRPDVIAQTEFMPTYESARAAAAWVKRNAQTELLMRVVGTKVRVRYEDLILRPSEHLSRIRKKLGLPELDLSFLEHGRITLHPQHSVAGNPRRFETGLQDLRIDDEWKMNLPTLSSAKVSLITAPLLLRYGYPLSTKRR